MTQLNMPNGGVSSLDEHEVMSYPVLSTSTLPVAPSAKDPTSIESYLLAVKQLEITGYQ